MVFGSAKNSCVRMGNYQSKIIRFCDWHYETKFIIVCDSLFRKVLYMFGEHQYDENQYQFSLMETSRKLIVAKLSIRGVGSSSMLIFSTDYLLSFIAITNHSQNLLV